jgi:hypothetical protein
MGLFDWLTHDMDLGDIAALYARLRVWAIGILSFLAGFIAGAWLL